MKCEVCLSVERLHGTTEWVSPWLCTCPQVRTLSKKNVQSVLQTESTLAVRLKFYRQYLLDQAQEIERLGLDPDGSAQRTALLNRERPFWREQNTRK